MPHRRSLIRLAATTTMVAGALLASACTSSSTPAPQASGTPTATASGEPTATKPAAPQVSDLPRTPAVSDGPKSPAAGVFTGTRQVSLRLVDTKATLTVADADRLGLTTRADDRALFVLTPAGGERFQIRTATLRVAGEAGCVRADGDGSRPAAVVVAACDTRDGNQLFRFRHTGDVAGEPKYTIRTSSDSYLVHDADRRLLPGGTGVVAVQIGEGTPDIDTPFLLTDRGEAKLPTLD